jgi:hypothetical protein
VHTYNSSYIRGISRRIETEASHRKNARTYLKNNESKKWMRAWFNW